MKTKIKFLGLMLLFVASNAWAQKNHKEVTIETTLANISITAKWEGTGIASANGVTLSNGSATHNIPVTDGKVSLEIRFSPPMNPAEFTELHLSHQSITNLTITNHPKLTILICTNNLINTLKISDCPALNIIDCANNQLTELRNVSNLTSLQKLHCYDNKLSTLNVSGCTALKDLNCYNNKLSTLNVSGCTALKDIICYNNRLSSLNVSGLTALKSLDCSRNKLATLNVLGCPALKNLNCFNNELSNLNVSGCPALETLDCPTNNLTSLNVTGRTTLRSLDCSGNLLETLNVSGLPVLTYLFCSENKLTTLNVSGCTALEKIFCNENKLTTLNVSESAALVVLICYNNKLTSLDISNSIKMSNLCCSNNAITTLKVSDSLRILECNNNILTSIDISKCDFLESINCSNNELTSLNVSHCNLLQLLKCSNNKLASLIVSECRGLKQLHCDYNNLTRLNINGCSLLSDIKASDQFVSVYSSTTGNFINPIEYTNKFGTEPIRIGNTTYAKGVNLPTPVSGYKLMFNTNIVGGNAANTDFSGTISLLTVLSREVTGITINQQDLQLRVGFTATLTSTIIPQFATNSKVTWKSSNPNIAKISIPSSFFIQPGQSNAIITAIAPGTAIITVETDEGNYTATCIVNVIPVIPSNIISKTAEANKTNFGSAMNADYNEENDNLYNASLIAFPNPTTGMVTVTGLTAGKTINIYGIAGTLVGTYIAQGEEMTLNLDNLSKGFYFLNFKGKTIKIIKD